MCNFEHACPFWYKTTRKYFVQKFRPIVTPVISYSIANFLMQCLGMPSEHFLAWTRKHSPTFLRQVLDVCVPRVPWRSTWKLMCWFFIVMNARQILTIVCKVFDVPFDWGIYIDMYYRRNFLIDQPTLLKSSWYFPKQDFKPKICLRAWQETGVNMCLHHARNRIAVQNNALISTTIFDLKQVYWFYQLYAM